MLHVIGGEVCLRLNAGRTVDNPLIISKLYKEVNTKNFQVLKNRRLRRNQKWKLYTLISPNNGQPTESRIEYHE